MNDAFFSSQAEVDGEITDSIIQGYIYADRSDIVERASDILTGYFFFFEESNWEWFTNLLTVIKGCKIVPSRPFIQSGIIPKLVEALAFVSESCRPSIWGALSEAFFAKPLVHVQEMLSVDSFLPLYEEEMTHFGEDPSHSEALLFITAALVRDRVIDPSEHIGEVVASLGTNPSAAIEVFIAVAHADSSLFEQYLPDIPIVSDDLSYMDSVLELFHSVPPEILLGHGIWESTSFLLATALRQKFLVLLSSFVKRVPEGIEEIMPGLDSLLAPILADTEPVAFYIIYQAAISSPDNAIAVLDLLFPHIGAIDSLPFRLKECFITSICTARLEANVPATDGLEDLHSIVEEFMGIDGISSQCLCACIAFIASYGEATPTTIENLEELTFSPDKGVAIAAKLALNKLS